MTSVLDINNWEEASENVKWGGWLYVSETEEKADAVGMDFEVYMHIIAISNCGR